MTVYIYIEYIYIEYIYIYIHIIFHQLETQGHNVSSAWNPLLYCDPCTSCDSSLFEWVCWQLFFEKRQSFRTPGSNYQGFAWAWSWGRLMGLQVWEQYVQAWVKHNISANRVCRVQDATALHFAWSLSVFAIYSFGVGQFLNHKESFLQRDLSMNQGNLKPLIQQAKSASDGDLGNALRSLKTQGSFGSEQK